MPLIPQKVIAEWRNRVEATFGEITDQMELARHGAHTFGGLLTHPYRRHHRRAHPAARLHGRTGPGIDQPT
jgi:hypothetical protein